MHQVLAVFNLRKKRGIKREMREVQNMRLEKKREFLVSPAPFERTQGAKNEKMKEIKRVRALLSK